MLKVELLTHTPDPEKIVAAAAKLCYSNDGIENLIEHLDEQNISKFLNLLMSMGHESPIEHVSFTFGIEGISRSLLAQITRHRIASYSVKSQRYVKEGQFAYITPPEIAEDNEALKIYQSFMKDSQVAYDKLTKILYDKHYLRLVSEGVSEKNAQKAAEKQAIEDARFVLPNACDTKIIVTMNARALINFFHHRLCSRAQWEIRALAIAMLKLVKNVAPTIFAKVAPNCVYYRCTEGVMTCGKQAEIKKFFTEDLYEG